MASSSLSSMTGLLSKQPPQVFINFRGDELRDSFVSHLVEALRIGEINYYIDTKEVASQKLDILFDRIDESKLALAIFSKRYSESRWCLNELVRIMERVKENKLKVVPIFFNVKVKDVKEQIGEFGNNLYAGRRRDLQEMKEWERALRSVGKIMGLRLEKHRSENDFIVEIVKTVKILLATNEGGEVRSSFSSVSSTSNISLGHIEQPEPELIHYGMQRRLQRLEEKLNFDCPETRIVGIVGMAGIGKTTLAEMHFNKWNDKFLFNQIFIGIREQSKREGRYWLKNKLMNPHHNSTYDGLEGIEIFEKKVFIVLDDVSDKVQVEFLQENLHRIKKGSKIVITTRDKSSIEGLVDDIYVVPGLSDAEALKLFNHHAFIGDKKDTIWNLSKTFVDYAGGNPLCLKELGKELYEKDKAHWEERLETLPYRCNDDIRTKLRSSYDDLSVQQKDVFLDIACFFRSEDEDYVSSLLESSEEIRGLLKKFLITISGGKIEMEGQVCSLGKELGLSRECRLWDHQRVTKALLLVDVKEMDSVRGIFLDMSKLPRGMALKPTTLKNMLNLRYLKIYDSLCSRKCEVDCKVNLPEGLVFPLQQIRYFHWLKFPLEELPSDFRPENLIDLRLPYSKIRRVWEGVKDTPNLKWVDLNYSTELIDLSALSRAESLRQLNLEGCTKLKELRAGEMQNMKSLSLLNLRGCTSLLSLPLMNLISLTTLILSNCSNLKEFEVISSNLEYLHLDGTAIQGLPSTFQNLNKLVVLNLKDCKYLESLPDSLHKLKALEELILSGCSRLASFPETTEIMENLQILLLDGTSIKEVPKIFVNNCDDSIEQRVFQRLWRPPQINGMSSLRRISLSRNDMIFTLQSSISQLYNLKWLDLKYCKNLASVSTLPPNLQCLDAHACVSLRAVASPLALPVPADQLPSSFIFTNCGKLEHTAKNEILCYAHNKSRLISTALNRHNKGLAFVTLVSTCFPGSEVPAWFCHRASGAKLEPVLSKHWSDESGFVGIALCAIVLFKDFKIQNSYLRVKFNDVETSSSSFNCHVGGLSETGDDEQRTINSSHVIIGYTSWLNIDKCEQVMFNKRCVPTKAVIEFNVTDGTGQILNCEVVKCGFSLVCESGNGSWEAKADAVPRTQENKQGESRPMGFFRRILSLTS